MYEGRMNDTIGQVTQGTDLSHADKIDNEIDYLRSVRANLERLVGTFSGAPTEAGTANPTLSAKRCYHDLLVGAPDEINGEANKIHSLTERLRELLAI